MWHKQQGMVLMILVFISSAILMLLIALSDSILTQKHLFKAMIYGVNSSDKKMIKLKQLIKTVETMDEDGKLSFIENQKHIHFEKGEKRIKSILPLGRDCCLIDKSGHKGYWYELTVREQDSQINHHWLYLKATINNDCICKAPIKRKFGIQSHYRS